MLEVHHLEKSFADNPALRQVSFSADKGEIVALVGRNGAGKSTLMRLIAGCLMPDSGEILLSDDMRIGYLPEGAPLYDELTPRACLDFVIGAHGIKGAARRKRVKESLEKLDLTDHADQVLNTLSKGYQRRTALGMALAPEPHLLILDEPFDGFDPIQKHAAVNLLKSISPNTLILISTHSLKDAERLCSRMIVIENGRISADTSPKALLKETGTDTLDAAFRRLVGGTV
ncbi:MAG: multidrug ABC transporter ATP-binding protein [Robiginitomaculum sp.]|nr:MAG: multidrug ABC transporter ATP-binding protein [Robiginitomaculum sp.]